MTNLNLSHSPLLACMNGIFHVESQSLRLQSVSTGTLFLNSGFLAIVDPFADMTRGGNLGILLNPGQYETWVTQVQESQTQENQIQNNSQLQNSYISGMMTPHELDQLGPNPLDPKGMGKLNPEGLVSMGSEPASDGIFDGSIYGKTLLQTIQQNTSHVRTSPAFLDEKPEPKFFRNAYLTLVVHPEKWMERQKWVQTQQQQQQSPAIPKMALRYLHLTSDGHPPHEIPNNEETFIGVPIDAGTCAMVDDEALIEGMPSESNEPGWDKALFDHGVPHSWFDAMDSGSPLPQSMANIRLPLLRDTTNQSNLVLCESGYGDGYYPIIGEYAFDPTQPTAELSARPTLIAIHVNFQIIPEDLAYPVAQNTGER